MLKKFTVMLLSIILLNVLLISSERVLNITSGRNFFVDEQQNIYTDYDSYSVVKYSPDGKELMRFGRKGEGPGDIKRIGWFAINPINKLLYVTERVYGNRRVSMFSTESGKYVDNWKFDFDWNKWEGIEYIQFDYLGNVYIEAVRSTWRRYKSFTIGALEKAVIKYSPSGKKLKEIYRLKSDFMAEKPGKGQITIPHNNYLCWKINKNRVVIRENSKPYIYVFNLKGILIKKIKLPFEKKILTDKDLDEWEKYLRSIPEIKRGISQGWFDLKFWRKNLPFPKYKNISGSQLFFDSDGHLYSKKASSEDDKENIWAEIDINTNRIELINFPTKYGLIFIKDKNFYFDTFDKDGEDIIIIMNKESIKNKLMKKL